jgi:TPR repeat protein
MCGTYFSLKQKPADLPSAEKQRVLYRESQNDARYAIHGKRRHLSSRRIINTNETNLFPPQNSYSGTVFSYLIIRRGFSMKRAKLIGALLICFLSLNSMAVFGEKTEISDYEMALAYLSGDRVPLDPAKAIELLGKAAEAGHSEAMTVLATCYETGYGTAQNMELALKWHMQAAEKQVPASMYFIGQCYAKGTAGLEQSHTTAVAWYTVAAEKGSLEATGKLGACYAMGQGTDQDIQKGLSMIQKAAAGGDADSIYNLGVCHERGIGMPKNMNKAVQYYRQGAEAGCHEAMYNLSVCLASGKGIEKNEAEAKKWRAESANSNTPLRGRNS